jgi:hypothetical protein
MSRISGTALAGLAAALVPLCAQTPGAALPPLVIDGSLGDAFWAAVRRQNLQPDEAGIPAELGGTFALALRGNWLCFAAQMPEPGGKVLARAFGPHVIWQKDADGAPPVEDRLEYRRITAPQAAPNTSWQSASIPGAGIVSNRMEPKRPIPKSKSPPS